MNKHQRGQVLPLFALMLVSLFAIAALAIDVSGVYAARRAYRTAADAAALAGGQDLQLTGSRSVTSTQYSNARSDAIASLVKELGGTSSCTTVVNRSDCTLTDPVSGSVMYQFSVITPIPAGSCASCDPDRSIQVSVANPAYSLSFSRLIGFPTFRIGVTAVAGLGFNSAYAVVALRPPASATVPDVRDIYINGGTKVVVSTGDVASNANMLYNGTGSILQLDAGYRMDYYDQVNPPLWTPPTPASPPGHQISALVLDPGYPVPVKGSSPPIGAADTSANCTPIAAYVYTNANYVPSVPTAGGAPDMSNITCYKPGVYASGLTIANGTLAILEPGLYFFDGVLTVNGSLIGGYTPSSPGVALVFPETQGTMFKARTSGGSSSLAQLIALNAGTKYQNPGGTEALAARDYSNNPIQTNTASPLKMSVIVPPDPNCPVVLPWQASCSNHEENQNSAIDLSGGSGVYLAGVQYAPSDNVKIAGNSATGGYVGQVWAWTLFYTGGSTISQEGQQSVKAGTLRLDAACTAPSTPCAP